MANQKPVDEIRIGRVKATVWKNGTEDQPRYNVTFSRLYKIDDQWMSTHSFGRNDLLVLAKVADLAHHAALPASGRRRTTGGSGRRVLADTPHRERRSHRLRRFALFLSRTFPYTARLRLGELPARRRRASRCAWDHLTKREKSYAKENHRLWRCRVEVNSSLSSGKAAQWRQNRVLL